MLDMSYMDNSMMMVDCGGNSVVEKSERASINTKANFSAPLLEENDLKKRDEKKDYR